MVMMRQLTVVCRDGVCTQRREQKEADEKAKEKAREVEAEERAQFFERRRKAKEKARQMAQAQQAVDASHRLERVCVEAEAALARAQQECDQLDLRVARGKQVGAGERERLQRKLVKAVAFAAQAKRNVEANQAVANQTVANGKGKSGGE